MASLSQSRLFPACCFLFVVLLCYSTPVSAFGAGNIVSVSKVSGKNWRHGDIEDTLLELFISLSGRAKFDRLAVKRVYFGNWLRDYSQAIDVGGLKQLPKDTIRVMLWVLSFVTFGFATGEFEVTEERLGCYRPEEHIDNPKDYADNMDARSYDPRLRGPVNEEKELAIDKNNGMKVYIASEHAGIDTSAGFVRKCFSKSIQCGRRYAKDGNEADLYEALRMLGTGLHCLEDFAAHSNYVELALRELKVDAFAHVGENCRVKVDGKTIWPVVTGTFGMTDFLHSVVGEVSDKVVQSEVQALETQMDDACNQSKDGATSTLKGILDNIPFGLLGLGDSDFGSEAEKIQEQANAKELEQKASIDPNNKQKGVLDPEDLKRQASQTAMDIYPILEFHDKVMKAMMKGIDQIPGASELLENLTGALQIFIFSVLAPYIKPILERAKVELAAGSTGILEASEKGQYIVFNDDDSNNPTHSMLSKDHFTNVLNEVAGRVASETVRFVVPLIVEAWEDEAKNAQRLIDQALQVLHHPRLRKADHEGQQRMFKVVRDWWEEKDHDTQQHLRDVLSKEGVKEGKNHEGEDPIGGPGGKNHNHGSCGHGYSKGEQSQRHAASDGSHAGYGSEHHRGTVIEKPQKGMGSFLSGGGVERNREENMPGNEGRKPNQTEHTESGRNTGGSGQREEAPQGGVSSLLRGIRSSIAGGGGSNNNRSRDEQTPSYRGQNTTHGSSSRNQDREISGYGGTSSYHREGEGETSAYGGPREIHNSSNSYGQDTGSVLYSGRGEEESTGSYGRSGRNTRDEHEGPYRSSRTVGHQGGHNSSHQEMNDPSTYNRESDSSPYGSRTTRQDIEREIYGGQGSGRRTERPDSGFDVGEETPMYGSGDRSGRGEYGRNKDNDSYNEDTYSGNNTYSSKNSHRNNEEEEGTPYGGGVPGYRSSEQTSYDNSSTFGHRKPGEYEETTPRAYGRDRDYNDTEDHSYGDRRIPGGFVEESEQYSSGGGYSGRGGGHRGFGNSEEERYQEAGSGYGKEY